MENIVEEKNKIIKSFFIIGLNESLIQKYEEEENPPRFTQDIDIFVKDLPHNYKPQNDDEKWILIIKEKNVWLRIKYSNNYNSPITDLQLIECDYESPEYLLLEKKYIDEQYNPLMVTYYKKDKQNDEDKNDQNETFPIFSEFKLCKEYSDVYVKIPSELNVKDILNLKIKSKSAVLLISRKYTSLPYKDITIKRKQNGTFNFAVSKNKSPYSYKYLPEILDQYPPGAVNNSSVSMFCFPEGLTVTDQYKMPRWFNFVLTDEVGERTYGSTLIIWEEIETKLIESFVPIYNENDKKSNKKKYYFIQKAICILSKFPFYHNCLRFLKQLYKIQTASKSKIPLERAICTFVNSLYIQSNEIIQFIIGEEKLNFYRIANYGELWDTKNTYLEVLFRVLSYKQIITAWQGLLLEKKLFLLCSSKATLSCVAHGLINLLFPFKWIHVLVPILPEKLKLFIDSPVPLIIGISFPVDLNDFPSDALILNINKNKFENFFSPLPKIRGKIQAVFEKKLRQLKEKYNIDNPVNPDKWMDFQDEVIPSFELDKHKKIDTTEIRDAFYNVFIAMFKNYNKYIDWEILNKNINNNQEEDLTEKIFKRKVFLKDHSSDENDFISLFSETTLFTQFIEPFLKMKTDGAMGYFLESIKNGKGNKNVYLPKIIPETVRQLPEIDIRDLNGQTFFHKTFPNKLDANLFIQPKKIEKSFKSKFIKYEDEWCYQINNLKKKEWPKYMLYLIYEIWFHFFSFVIHFYGNRESLILMDYAVFLLEDLNDNKKITPTRNLFSKIFKSCGRDELKVYVKKILLLVNKIFKNSKFSNLFHNSYLSGLYALTENIGTNNTITIASTNSYLNITAIRTTFLNEMYSDDYDNKTIIDNIIFIDSKICPSCVLNKKKLYKINPEQILAGFNLDKEKSYIICPECLAKIEPYLFYLKKSQSNLVTHKFYLIPPHKLIQDIDIFINEGGEISFYKKVEATKLKQFMDIYLSIIFYFQLFDLPLFVLYTPKNNNQNFINELSQEIQLNKLRKLKRKDKRKSGKSISPDRVSRSPDKSTDNKSGVSSDITDYSRKSSISNISGLENEIWKNIQNSYKNNQSLINDKINPTEKSEFINRIKEVRAVLSKIIFYFYLNSKEKVEKFLSNLEEKQENAMGMIKKENELNTHTKVFSNDNLENNVKKNLNEKYDINALNQNEDKIKNRNIKNMDIINNQNIKALKIRANDEEDMKYLENNDDNENINMSFSGIIEIQEEEKNKKLINDNNILNNIEQEHNLINTNTNIQKDIPINNNNINNDINNNKIKTKLKHRISFEETSPKIEDNKYQTNPDKNKNVFDFNEKKISEFNINDKVNNQNKNDMPVNNPSTTNNDNNNENGEIRKNSTVGKRKKKIKIISGNPFD